MKRTNAQSKADKKYDAKRALSPRLPASHISESENNIFQSALKNTGKNKKDTIIEGLSLIRQYVDCDTCCHKKLMLLSPCRECLDFDKWELKE